MPLHTEFGPILRVMALMLGEVLKFLIPAAGILAGFACALYVVFRDDSVEGFDTLPNSMLTLVQVMWTRGASTGEGYVW